MSCKYEMFLSTLSFVISTCLMYNLELKSLQQVNDFYFLRYSLTSFWLMVNFLFASINPRINTGSGPLTVMSP